MRSFHPYIIHHLQLDSIQNFNPSKENQYIVIWFEKIPLGHVWLEYDESLQRETFLSYIQKAIYSSVEYYMIFSVNTEWKRFLTENDFIRLSAALKEAVHQFKTKLNQNNTE